MNSGSMGTGQSVLTASAGYLGGKVSSDIGYNISKDCLGVDERTAQNISKAIEMVGAVAAEAGTYKVTVSMVNKALQPKSSNTQLVDGSYIKDGKPNGRPQLSGKKKLEFETDVYDNQVDPDGILRDPNTGETTDWKPEEPRKGTVDFGHTEGNSYAKMLAKNKNGEITLDQLKEFQFKPDNFRLETPSANKSHLYE